MHVIHKSEVWNVSRPLLLKHWDNSHFKLRDDHSIVEGGWGEGLGK